MREISPMVSRVDKIVEKFNAGASLDDLVRSTGLAARVVLRCLTVMEYRLTRPIPIGPERSRPRTSQA